MATKFRQVREQMAPERRERIRARTEELLAELPVQELRQARANFPRKNWPSYSA